MCDNAVFAVECVIDFVDDAIGIEGFFIGGQQGRPCVEPFFFCMCDLSDDPIRIVGFANLSFYFVFVDIIWIS